MGYIDHWQSGLGWVNKGFVSLVKVAVTMHFGVCELRKDSIISVALVICQQYNSRVVIYNNRVLLRLSKGQRPILKTTYNCNLQLKRRTDMKIAYIKETLKS